MSVEYSGPLTPESRTRHPTRWWRNGFAGKEQSGAEGEKSIPLTENTYLPYLVIEFENRGTAGGSE